MSPGERLAALVLGGVLLTATVVVLEARLPDGPPAPPVPACPAEDTVEVQLVDDADGYGWSAGDRFCVHVEPLRVSQSDG